tara:strand:- start:258 stop:467 length:210 start_codon:yes stop_codon:yes gene_type:complete
MISNNILTDNFGDKWVVEKGRIKYYDYAFNHDINQVSVVDYDDDGKIDLYYYNETHTKVTPLNPQNSRL